MTIQTKATEQYFPVVLFIILFKVVLTVESVNTLIFGVHVNCQCLLLGPQCYVKPSGKSNRKIIVNAISHVCLSGTVNQDQKEKCLQVCLWLCQCCLALLV